MAALVGVGITMVSVLSERRLNRLLNPALSVAVSYYQGMLVHARRTRAITEALIRNVVSSFENYAKLSKKIPSEDELHTILGGRGHRFRICINQRFPFFECCR